MVLRRTALQLLEAAGWANVVNAPQSASGVLRALEKLASEDSPYLCRGEPALYQDGGPSLARTPVGTEELWDQVLLNAEAHLIAQFRRRAAAHLSLNEIELTRTVWGTLVLMQHYRAPTRLLDWSLSPWVATYFAACSSYGRNGHVFAFKLDARPKAQPDASDHLTKLVRIHGLTEWKQAMHDWARSLAQPHPQASRQTDPERQWVEPVQPMRATPRMVAQQSYFTFGVPAGTDHRKWLGKRIDDSGKRLIIIRRSVKQKLLTLLSKMNLTSASLYPDLGGAGQSIADILAVRMRTPPTPVDDWAGPPGSNY